MDESRAKELLKAERERVEGELAKVRGEGREDSTAETPAGDFNNENLYEDEFSEGREGARAPPPEAAGGPEERLAAGPYGLSVKSGEPIPDGRLEAEPIAELT